MQKKHLARVLTASTLVLGLVSIATEANAAPNASIATNGGIAVTKHNLGTSNRTTAGTTLPLNSSLWNSTTMTGTVASGNQWTNGTDEICVFCHTPHGSNTTSAVNAPLWNRLAGTATYTPYTSGSMQGNTTFTGGNMSLACLSCHDGTQAMDAMVNKAGASGLKLPSGAFVEGAYRMSGNGTFLWYGSAAPRAANTPQFNGQIGDPTRSTSTSWDVQMLGTDLSNDHPIGMAYCGGGQTATGSNTGCNDLDFVGLQSQTGTGATASFYVGNGTQKQQMRAYGATTATATVECGSCHDPHSAENRTFLRTSNAGSSVCLACHIK